MSGEPQLYRVNPENRESEKIQEVEFSQLGIQERRDIQEWVAANPGILGDDLLIIGKEFSGFDRTNERLDLLAVDRDGKLVIIELKRDDTGADAHWQAIKYASYFQRATADVIVRMMAEYLGQSEEDSANELLTYLNADDLNGLNRDQRIILASHRFAPEVTTAALWLNQKIPAKDLITCVKLTPYRDAQTESLYVQASTIIPVPGVDVVGVGPSVSPESGGAGSRLGAKLSAAFARNRNDEVTAFLRKVGNLVMGGLSHEVRPEKTSRWAGGYESFRYYQLWYQRWPWSRSVSYRVHLVPQEDDRQWAASVVFAYWDGIEDLLDGTVFHPLQGFDTNSVWAEIGADTLDDDFAGKIAGTMRGFIERITPLVEGQAEVINEEEA